MGQTNIMSLIISSVCMSLCNCGCVGVGLWFCGSVGLWVCGSVYVCESVCVCGCDVYYVLCAVCVMRNLNRRERESERVSHSKGAVYAPSVWWLWVGVIECAARRCLRSGWSLLSMRPVPSERVRRELVRFEKPY